MHYILNLELSAYNFDIYFSNSVTKFLRPKLFFYMFCLLASDEACYFYIANKSFFNFCTI